MTDYNKISLKNFLKIGEEFVFYSDKAIDLKMTRYPTFLFDDAAPEHFSDLILLSKALGRS